MSDIDAREKLQPELFPEEKLLWSGRPVQGVRLERSDLGGILLGIIFIAIAVGLLLTIFDVIPIPTQLAGGSQEFKTAFWVWIIGLLPIGLYLAVFGRYVDAFIRSRFFYGVTNERILSLHGKRSGTQALISLRIRDVPHLYFRVDPDGTGSLFFRGYAVNAQRAHPIYLLSFYLIPEVRTVYSLVRAVQRAQAQS
jgi:hypothetical protein